MTVESAQEDARKKMRGAIAVLQDQFSGIRTGRATPALLSRITFEYYGTQQPLKDMASVSVPEPRLLVIQPFDKGAISAMERAIQTSDLGLTPTNDGNVIRLSFPPLTEERRRDLIKVVKERAEEDSVFGPRRVFRGGSWVHFGQFCRSASRGWFAPDNADMGLRVALVQ